MRIELFEQMVQMAQSKYRQFHDQYGEHLLMWDECTAGCRRSVLKCKTIGLISHDRILVQDVRLQQSLKLDLS